MVTLNLLIWIVWSIYISIQYDIGIHRGIKKQGIMIDENSIITKTVMRQEHNLLTKRIYEYYVFNLDLKQHTSNLYIGKL